VTGVIGGRWDVVVVGGRIAGASAAWALAPYAGRVLVVDASPAARAWPQQSTWDREGNVLWRELGLLDVVLACGAPPTYGHTFRTGDDIVEHEYPQDIDLSYRMCVPRGVLDRALIGAAESRGNVTVVRPARLRGIATEDGRVAGVTVHHDGVDRHVGCDLLVLADGRRSRGAALVDATPYREVPSPWFSLLVYHEGLPLRSDRGYFSLQDGHVLIGTPSGPDQWCVSAALHQRLIDGAGRTPAQVFTDLVDKDPHLGPAVAAGRRLTPVNGAGRLSMLRRPMSGPGWCLVGDSGYHLDPVTAFGTRAALAATRILRDRIAELGGVGPCRLDATALDGLTALRDAALEDYWVVTEQILSA
jgi:2-polyprenyl-6-methoxyphenol hydroxylase-like FAD-dependent oxidoreductase